MRHCTGPVAIAALTLSLSLCSALSGVEPPPVSERAKKLHADALLIDGHNDLPWAVRTSAGGDFDSYDIAAPLPERFRAGQTDIPRLTAGGVDGQFWSVYVPADYAAKGKAAWATMEQIDIVHRMLKRYPETFELALTADDLERIVAEGRIASLIGVEGGHSIENSLGVLRMLHRLGARYMTLTHSETLDWADSATDTPRHGGLSPFGEEVVLEMNRLGMLVDISHVSAETMHDVLRVSRAPVIASHSSAYALVPHPRNVPDDVLRELPRNGGVIMVNFFSGFINPEAQTVMREADTARRRLQAEHPGEADFARAWDRWRREHPIPPGTLAQVVDHIDHIAKVAGIDHVGLGSDFDGVSRTPEGLEDVSRFPAITQALLDRGYADEEIRKVLGKNVLRVLRRAEQVAAEMQGQSAP